MYVFCQNALLFNGCQRRKMLLRVRQCNYNIYQQGLIAEANQLNPVLLVMTCNQRYSKSLCF